MTLTPEMLALREAAERLRDISDTVSHNDYSVSLDAYEDLATPTAILALLASYEELTAENAHAIDSVAQLQEEVFALQARLLAVRKLPNLTNPELMDLGARTCSVEGEHFLPMKFGRAVINALHDQLEAASVAVKTGGGPALQAPVGRAQELDTGYGSSEQDKFMAHIREKYPNMALDFMVRCDGEPVFNDGGTQARWMGWRDKARQVPDNAPFSLVNRLALIDPDADFDALELLREYVREAAGIVGRYEEPKP